MVENCQILSTFEFELCHTPTQNASYFSRSANNTESQQQAFTYTYTHVRIIHHWQTAVNIFKYAKDC